MENIGFKVEIEDKITPLRARFPYEGVMEALHFASEVASEVQCNRQVELMQLGLSALNLL